VSLSVAQSDYIRGLKGSAATILVALLFSGQSLTNKELQDCTGYSDKLVTEGIEKLERRGLVQYNGHYYGWSLPAGTRQLPLFPAALLGRGNSSHSATLGSEETASQGWQQLNGDRNFYDNRKISDLEVLSSSVNSKLKPEGEGNEEGGGRRVRKISDLIRQAVDNPVGREVYEWLRRGGVGATSPKMLELLRLGLTVEHVKAFVLDQEARKDPPNYLICKLLDGDPVPPMRCEDCLAVLAACYCEVVKR
jgi:hypothetical protein